MQRFTFVRDDDFELDERQEKELMVLAKDNKVTISSILSIQTRTLMKSRQCMSDNIQSSQVSQLLSPELNKLINLEFI